ncbi:hypothetical protein [Acidianus infernus]|uniref:hypothetical protein n=1 Tax=Acidianus infernus TaxID=12915 RepID=UPI003592FB55
MKKIDCRIYDCRNISNIIFTYAKELDVGEKLIIDIPKEYLDIVMNICEALYLKPLSVKLYKDYCSVMVMKEYSLDAKYRTEYLGS